MSAFERLSHALKFQIVNTLGFSELRPVQLASIDAILDGENVVVLAPTAGGKTEAAFFPLLSAMDDGDHKPVSVLYLSPIRALLNNQEARIARYAELVGRRVFKWHGDTAQGPRKKFLARPSDILLTTPESLEAMLMSSRVPSREIFGALRAVVIDEIHAFASDDRGAHLSSLLERLSRFSGRDIQRIGLSATVGNPEAIATWIGGSSRRFCRVVDPKGEKKKPEISLDYVGSVENAAHVIQSLHPGKKRLVFVDSRRVAEELGGLLLGRGLQAFVTHGSLSVAERRDAEAAFQDGKDCVIVATSALELGIDVGDLDHVLQIDSPSSVASFLQRLGRTGRRENVSPNCTFLATKDRAVLQAAALLELHRQGYVEPVHPSSRATHIYAHQVMALAIQQGGVARLDLDAWLEGASAFSSLPEDDRAAIVSHMLASEILADQEGRLWLGPVGEKRFGRANFRELYAVFDAPRVVTVRWNHEDVGTVDASFLAALDSGSSVAEPATFTLSGRAWQVITIEWERGICVVRPAPSGRAPRWLGSPRHLAYDLCQAMRRVLVSDEPAPYWSARARRVLETERAEHAFLRDEPSPMVERSDEITWYTFAGGAANLLLARMLEADLGGTCVSRNTSITLKGTAGQSAARVREALRRYAAEGRPGPEDARRFAEGATRGRVSKFQVCLPEPLFLELAADRVLDARGAREAARAAT